MKEIDYEKSIKLCIGRIREVFSDAKLERLHNVSMVTEDSTSYIMPVEYDVIDHKIHIDNERIHKVEDPSHALMYGVLQAVTTDPETKNQGVCFKDRMESINRGITHMISNLLVPSLDKEDSLFTSCVVSNIFTNMAGAVTVFDAYFNSNDLSLAEMMSFNNTLFTDPTLAPSSQKERLISCTNSNLFVKNKIIEKKMLEGSKRIESHEDQLMNMFSKERVSEVSEGKKR